MDAAVDDIPVLTGSRDRTLRGLMLAGMTHRVMRRRRMRIPMRRIRTRDIRGITMDMGIRRFRLGITEGAGGDGGRRIEAFRGLKSEAATTV
jgi:hypothetical protein